MDKKSMIGYIINEAISEPTDIKVVSDKGNRIIAEGTLQDLESDNRNGRYYERKEIIPELSCARTKELLETGNMKGENGHPMSKDIARQQTIDPNFVCVKYLKFWMDGNDVKAQFKGTNNQLGEDFDNDLRDGELPSFSLRALGTIENKNGHACVRNTKIITYDRVIYPSHKRAYTEKIVSESASMTNADCGNKVVYEANDSGILIPITNDSVISYIKSESCNIKTIMNNFDTLYESIEVINNGKDVQLMDKFGNMFIVNLESYIQDEIMSYCYNA